MPLPAPSLPSPRPTTGRPGSRSAALPSQTRSWPSGTAPGWGCGVSAAFDVPVFWPSDALLPARWQRGLGTPWDGLGENCAGGLLRGHDPDPVASGQVGPPGVRDAREIPLPAWGQGAQHAQVSTQSQLDKGSQDWEEVKVRGSGPARPSTLPLFLPLSPLAAPSPLGRLCDFPGGVYGLTVGSHAKGRPPGRAVLAMEP